MKLRTDFDPAPSAHKITPNSRILTLGSCFAEIMGQQLQANKLNVSVSPFGTLFNPLSIHQTIKVLCQESTFDPRLFLENRGQHLHYQLHSSFVAKEKNGLTAKIDEVVEQQRAFLKQADWLILTYGTAFVYRLVEPPTVVANCHKMPAVLFEKDLLSVKDICKDFAVLWKNLKKINPQLKVILTVSPVRHTREGIPQNQVSKAILRAACYYITTDFEEVDYFPSYEIMMDDLRDYRFYKPDLIHPNEVAEAYIFEKFSQTYFSQKLLDFLPLWQSIQKSLQHRPLDEGSASHQQFLHQLLQKLQALPVNVWEEIKEVKKRMLL